MTDKVYHELMSEIYSTRAFMWMMFAIVTFKICEHPLNIASSGLSFVNSIVCIVHSYREYRRSQ